MTDSVLDVLLDVLRGGDDPLADVMCLLFVGCVGLGVLDFVAHLQFSNLIFGSTLTAPYACSVWPLIC